MFSPATSPSGYSPPLNSPAIGREQPSDPEKGYHGQEELNSPIIGREQPSGRRSVSKTFVWAHP